MIRELKKVASTVLCINLLFMLTNVNVYGETCALNESISDEETLHFEAEDKGVLNQSNNVTSDCIETVEEAMVDENLLEDQTVDDTDNSIAEEINSDMNEVQTDETTVNVGDKSLINYFLIESPYLETPSTQNFVLSFGDGTQNITSMSLFYQKDGSDEVELPNTMQQANLFKFCQSFNNEDSGIYRISKINYVLDEQKYEINFNDAQMDICFGVNQKYDGYENLIDLDQSESNAVIPELVTLDSSNINNAENEIINTVNSTSGDLISTFANQKEPIVIALDPGHGGTESGMIAVNGVQEKVYTLKIANYLKNELEKYDDVKVVMTRTDDVDMGLQERAEKASSLGANVLISLHLNAFNKEEQGAEVYYPNENYRPDLSTEGKNLAQQIQNELVALGLKNRGLKIRHITDDSKYDYPDGTIADYYGIIRHSKNLGMAAIIVEHCFADNQNDFNNYLDSEEKIKSLAVTDAKGIAKAYGLVKNDFSIRYQSHIQNLGWQEEKSNGMLSGTVGQRLQMEAIKININDSLYDGGVQYSSHIQDIGWQDWKSNGDISGTTGKCKRLEAIRIELTGTMEEMYDIYYRSHVQNYGWLGWAKNGEKSGSEGYGYRLEGIEIQLVPKGNNAPGSISNSFKKQFVRYQSHIQNIGWQEEKSNGMLSGTVGQRLQMEAIKININDSRYDGGIRYSTDIQNLGWQDWKYNGEISGTTGRFKRLEAIRIELTGTMQKMYDVYYRVHAQEFGWLGWAKNGEKSGTEGYGYRLEGIEIQLVPKGNEAPGSVSNPFYKKINYRGYVQFNDGIRYYRDDGTCFIGDGYTDKAYLTTDSTGLIKGIKTLNIPFYMQNDPRWGGIWVGGHGPMSKTGCVPTCMTSIINYYKGTNYTPLNVANLLYNSGYFNRSFPGASSEVWQFISNYFSMDYKNNLNKQGIINSLKQGKIVTLAVDASYYGHFGYTHQIMLTGYVQDGRVYVHDPLWSSTDGWRSLDGIMSHLSRDPIDTRNGGPIFAI